jgi:starvation-inducible outer membrane lipoprotein
MRAVLDDCGSEVGSAAGRRVSTMSYATAHVKGKEPIGGLIIACLALVSACSPSVFPYKALDGVNHDFDFLKWQVPQGPDSKQKVQLGGRIVRAELNEDMVTITATQLLIPKDPTQEPVEDTSSGEFLIRYSAAIDPLVLRSGNKLIVVGEIGSPGPIEGDNKGRGLLTITALCIHFWNTDGKAIVLRGSSSSGTKFLAELTYCKTGL